MNKSPKEEQAATEGRRFEDLVNGPSDRPDTQTGERRIVRNADNDRLLPWGDETFIVGYVDEVNGAGAKEVPQYAPTRHELVQLVKYWYGRILDNDFFRFQYGGSDSGELRIGRFAPRRIRRAAAAIGQEAVDKAIEDVRDQFKAKVDDDPLWDIFDNGTAEQWDAVQAEAHRQLHEQYAAAAIKRFDQLEKESPGDFIALVLRDWPDDKGAPVLISPTDSELRAVLQASSQFQVETDKSKVRVLMVDRQLTGGFLRATRHNGEWMFEFPDFSPGTVGWHFLESVASQIKKLLCADTGKGSRPA